MIVGVDARPLSSRVSGVARVISRILTHFPDKKIQFHLYSASACHTDYADVMALKNVEWKQGRGFSAKKAGLWFNSTLPLELRNSEIDIFWGAQQVLPPFLPRRIRSVLTFYDLVAIYFPNAMRTIARIQQRAFLNYSVKRADRILCISDQTRRDMIKELDVPSEKAAVSLLGVDVPGSSPGRDSGKKQRPYILAVSTIEPRKNYATLLAAYLKYSAAAKSPYRLVIAGRKGWEKPELYAQLRSAEASGLVTVRDSLSDSELNKLYYDCAFLAIPSIYEGFGLTLLEALARNKFAIASDLPCFHEIGGKQIEYVPATDVDAWTRAITRNTDLHSRKKLRAIKFKLKDWSWDRTAEIHADAFASV